MNTRFAFGEADLQHWAVEAINHQWLGSYLDANTVQTLATRAFKATQQYAFSKHGRSRFKGHNDLDYVEGKTNAQGIRRSWRNQRGELVRRHLCADTGNNHEEARQVAK